MFKHKVKMGYLPDVVLPFINDNKRHENKGHENWHLAQQNNFMEHKKFLVIRFKYIGDVMMTSVICNTLKKNFPNAEIHFAVHEVSACLFKHDPNIDKVISISTHQRKNPLAYLSLLRNLSKERYDVIIDANSTGKSELISLVSPKAAMRIGRQNKRRGFFYTHKMSKEVQTGHKIQQRLCLLQPLIDAGHSIVMNDSMKVILTEGEKINAQELLRNAGRQTDKPLIIFSVSSRETQKQWRRDYMQEVALHCINNLNAQILLYSGAPHEEQDIELFHRELGDIIGNHTSIISSIKTSNLRELAALFSQADMFVGNECGPRHIAQALDIPSASIYSPSADKSHWLPSNTDRHLGIEWRDTAYWKNKQGPDFEYGDTNYFTVYNHIIPSDVIPVVEQVFENHVKNNRLIPHTQKLL